MAHRSWRGWLRLAALAAGLLAADAAEAGADAPAARRVTLAEARDVARRAPAHRAAVARRTAAAAAVAAAGAWPATTVGVSSNARTARLGVVATVPLPLFGTLGANRGVARAELEVAGAEESAVNLTLRREATLAWLELVRAQERADRAARNAVREDELVVIAEQRFDAGDGSHAEVTAAMAGARRAHAQAAADAAAISSASAELAATLGWDPVVLLRASGGVSADVLVPALTVLRARRTGHPDARAASARAGAGWARVVEARRARWPALAFEVESTIDDPTLPGSDFRAGVLLELPLLGKGGATQRAAEARHRSALIERDVELAALDGRMVAAYRAYQAARDRARTLAEQVLPVEREAADLARSAYRENEGGLVAVVTADRALADAEGEASDALVAAAAARALLEWAAGGDL